MRRPKDCLKLATVACILTCRAIPCAAFSLSVERPEGTEDCPDAASLAARIREIRGSEADSDETTYAVRFSRDGKAFSAEIRVGEAQVRVLKARTESCTALAQGAAVTVAMLLDTDPARHRSQALEVDRSIRRRAHPLPAALPPRETGESTLMLRGWFSVSAGGLFGVLGSVAPEVSAEAGVGSRAFRIGVGGLWGMPRQLILSPGKVTESLGAATFRACWNGGLQESINPGLCVGAILGELHGEAHGFTLDDDHNRPWLALPIEVSVVKLNGTLGWELTASAFAEIVEHDFGIAGAGIAYRAPALGGMVALHGVVNFLR